MVELLIMYYVLGILLSALYPLSNPQQPFEADIIFTIL